MEFTSYMELFLTYYGWEQYNNIWLILTKTGIVLLPFIGIFIDNFIISWRAGGNKSVDSSLRAMEVDILLAGFVILLTAQPFTSISPGIATYEPACVGETVGVEGEKASPGKTGTTFDFYFGLENDVPIPVWWHGVLAISNGITNAAISGLSCPKLDYRATTIMLNGLRITEPDLVDETVQFYGDCYYPSFSQFQRKSEPLPDSFAKNDINWLGSKYFIETEGFYDNFRARRTIGPDYPYIAARDNEYPEAPSNGQGRPVCKDWWRVLEGKLFKEIQGNLSVGNKVVNATELGLSLALGSSDPNAKARDIVLRRAISQTSGLGRKHTVSYNTSGYNLEARASELSAIYGLAQEMSGFLPMMYILRESLSILQAIILMAIYALLPFAIIFSRFSLKMMITIAIGILTIKFWSYLWMFAWVLEQHLMPSMFPNVDNLFLSAFNPFDTEMGEGAATKILVIKLVVGAMYIGFPLIFSLLMGWIGAQSGTIATQLLRSTSSAGKGGMQGAAKSAVSASKVVASGVRKKLKSS